MKYQEPTAILISCEVKIGVTFTVLKFEKLPSSPLAPSSFGNITETNQEFIEFHKVANREGNIITFKTYGTEVCLLKAGKVYTFRPLWAPNQLNIAQSNPELWETKYFKASNMLAFHNNDGEIAGRKLIADESVGAGFVVTNGWDHEHCALCWKTISEFENEEHFGYNHDSNWVCQECFDKYIKSGFGKKLGDINP
jgi:hypothetical protein